MDFDSLAKGLQAQIAVIGNAPIPFAICVFLASLAIWRAMVWRYAGQIERLQSAIEHLKQFPAPAQTVTASAKNVTYSGRDELPLTKPAKETPKGDRIYLGEGVTLSLLAEQRKNKTSTQADDAQKAYIGKWMKITRTILNIEQSYNTYTVSFVPDPKLSIFEQIRQNVIAYFDYPDERLDILCKGEVISLQGQLVDVSDMGFSLEKCELF